MTTTAATQVTMPAAWLWLIRLGCPAIGFGLAFGVRPLADWLIRTVDSAPGPLRLAAELPQIWAIVLLTLAGGPAAERYPTRTRPPPLSCRNSCRNGVSSSATGTADSSSGGPEVGV